ncbi:MAG: hypothetical protein V4562_03645 [Pseudomonadota bacterium]
MITAHPYPLHYTDAAAPAPELPRWMVKTLETTGWAIYIGALGVLGSFGLVVCRALLSA